MPLTADFETLIGDGYTRVWAWAVYDIDTRGFIYGNTIEGFIKFIQDNRDTYYFHNLKFDGEFLIHWLLSNGFTHTHDKKLSDGEFTTIISDTGQWYAITIRFDKKGLVRIYDSLKIIPFSVEDVAKAFNLEMRKGKIDYIKDRPYGYNLTKDEIDYIYNDVAIMGEALKVLFDEGLNKITQASNAMADYKTTIPPKAFKYWFPYLEEDSTIRKAYKGGFTYLNPKYKNVIIGDGVVFDVNSLYPSVMYNEVLPYGKAIKYDGKYIENEEYPLYVQYFSCYFELKKDKIPTLQIRKSAYFRPNDYITTSDGRDYVLCMTSVDLNLFLEQYDVYGVEWLGGYKFRGCKGMFTAYIDKWSKVKIDADISGNNGMRTLAKLMLNALYGRFGLNPNATRKIPYLCDGVVKYVTGEQETRDPVYVPMAAFITAYARDKTIRAAQSVYKRFIYADTDSLHLIGTEMPDLDIDDTRTGAWKHESTFDRAKFIRQKTYIEHYTMHKNKKVDKTNITCAGLPKNVSYCYGLRSNKYKDKNGKPIISVYRARIDFNTFATGMRAFGKLTPKHVVGGVVLKEGTFSIK